MNECGGHRPLFVKIAPDLLLSELVDIIEVAIETGATGLILVNTTSSEAIKEKYDRHKEIGGLSGNEWEYRSVALHMTAEVYERAGDELEVIGVGGISTTEHAVERMLAGASMLQVVTAIREQKGRPAANINRDILDWMNRHKVSNIKEIIGGGTRRGPKY